MKKEELFHLLDEMSLPDAIIDKLDASVWCFWRKKHQLDDDQTLCALQEYIAGRNRDKDTKIRENAYALYGKLLRRNPKSEYGQFFVNCIGRETDKWILHNILRDIKYIHLSSEVRIDPIVACSKNDQWQIRQTAIMALYNFNTPESREAVRYWVGQEDEKLYKFELLHANAALGQIGEPGDIALLERHAHSHIRDVKDTAICAINNIRRRFGLSSDA